MLKIAEQNIKNLANSAFAKKHITKCIENPKFLTATLLATSVSKDVFAYALRVHNTVKNKEIPEDKKSFVAIMDAITGVTTAVVQLSTGFMLASDKVQKNICKHLFSELGEGTKKFKQASKGFSVVSTLVGATLFAKRIIVPLISSPIASYLEHKHNQKGNSN